MNVSKASPESFKNGLFQVGHLTKCLFTSVAQSCPILCDPIDYSTPGFPVHHQLPELVQTQVHWVSDAIQPSFHWTTKKEWKSWKVVRKRRRRKGGGKESESEVAQLCPTLSDPMDYSLPGSSVHGIFQARVLEWAAISFSRGSSQPRDQTWVSFIAGRHFTIWATWEAKGAGGDTGKEQRWGDEWQREEKVGKGEKSVERPEKVEEEIFGKEDLS